jgi:hypothetical protein
MYWLSVAVAVLDITAVVAALVAVFIIKHLFLFLELWPSLLEPVAQRELQVATEQMVVNLLLVAQQLTVEMQVLDTTQIVLVVL